MYLIKKQLRDFSYAHRLTKGYKGKCAATHGHSGHVKVVLASQHLDEFDMVIDFNELKMFDDWIQENLDHTWLVHDEDDAPTDKEYVMRFSRMPTAEGIAHELYCVFCDMLNEKEGSNVVLIEVEVWETDKCSAVYTEQQYRKEYEDDNEE